ncbi:Deoxyribodipyrimidine photo-lyase [Paraliobacillus sp. PM-2]|uniref:cryptochrome/photolyase family protein n=1 Tax=Paraliobacillus sp. PM-2 TaxID=1462524 RepID=UPI00061CBF30|nr:deoxyribodipyrimidine photo-lyase [Paraliobacillus sp. PM-2]CQR45990.1 Deoxyribodipyrimidine photo-lyase [Paraliobacillus sp. PM-2]
MTDNTIIVWFRKDLRLHDNPALAHAANYGAIVPVYILSEEEDQTIGSASKWWLHHSLQHVTDQLASYRVPLIIRKGSSKHVLDRLVKETNASAIYFNKRYEPVIREKDEVLIEQLQEINIDIKTFESALLFSPGSVTNKKGEPYKIFTPFWKQARKQPVSSLVLLPNHIESGVSNDFIIGEVDDLALLPKHPWTSKFHTYWKPGEQNAKAQWNYFLEEDIMSYDKERDYLAKNRVSQLSPHLAWGEISPRLLWHDIQDKLIQLDNKQQEEAHGEVESFLRQLVWRDFAYHQLVAFPHVIDEPLKPMFKVFAWQDNKKALERWKKGQTGYPLIDAGMRELWETGWMHNRVRMITASFLVKHLLIHWKEGAAWFRDTLVDHDLANNIMGWQWVAGSGYDASPYFRIFNPITQGNKFDPNARYIRKWIPEIVALPTKYLFSPWTAPKSVLDEAGIVLGETYPEPMVDHKASRERALATYYDMKEESK